MKDRLTMPGTVASRKLARVSAPTQTPVAIVDGALATETSVWSWVEIPASSTDLLEEAALIAETLEVASTLARLIPPSTPYHLKVLWTRHDGGEYLDRWQRFSGVPAPRMADYLDLHAQRITGHRFPRRVVLLGVRWDSTSTTPSPQQMWAALRSRKAAHRDARSRLRALAPALGRWHQSMSSSVLRARPAAASVLAWAYAREFRRGGDLVVPQRETLTGAELALLCDGTIDAREDPRALALTDATTGASSYLSVLVPATTGFPSQDLLIPGGEWLQVLASLPGVEASIRGQHHGQAGTRSTIDHATRIVTSQITEAHEVGSAPPREMIEAGEVLAERRMEVGRHSEVLATHHIRWIVDADSRDALDDRVARVIDTYGAMGITVGVPAHVQDLLWQETLPGEQVRVHGFDQVQPMLTLAGSWCHGGSVLGDEDGTYLGGNLGSTPAPLQLRLTHREGDAPQPTTMTFTGRSGTGKSTGLLLTLFTACAESAWALLTDFKGDLAGAVRAARTLLGIEVQEINALAPVCAGSMDPMLFAPDAESARAMTIDAVLGCLHPHDRIAAEALVEAAVDTVLRRDRGAWSTPAVIAELRLIEGPDGEQARELGAKLGTRAKHAAARPVLGAAAAGAPVLSTERGLCYLDLSGLTLPQPDSVPESWDISERLSVMTMRMSLRFAMMMSRRSRSVNKIVALTELHHLTAHAEGRALVGWIARTGRATGTKMLLDSQLAPDMIAVPGLLEQVVMAWCGRAHSPEEADAQAQLLGLPSAGPRLRQAMANLDVGQGILRDRQGRIGVMQFDLMVSWLAEDLSTTVAEDHAADQEPPSDTAPDPTVDGNPPASREPGEQDNAVGTADSSTAR